ncbi:hypothetical protein KXD93_26830 [Mucilaginibacter sp. BJC16-A38]|uniref:hypothetical protein n=1 Tax=Mucilaginibacter phenanthrenivorans TaxID=1234842 RepID=UPI002158602F|nr:hypothetical protein [Mucilaginibacter phenanthrenivorans]MCR8561297.1 hypothetical protein [Mucilaginibacter phenanthrenivorans]
MNPVFKKYLKISFIGFLLSLIFPAIVFFILKDKSYIFWFVIVEIIGLIPGYSRYKSQLEYEQRLKRRGLTPQDLNNIKFVKDWEYTRKTGLIKYSLVDGGIFYGFAFCFIISATAIFVKKDLFTYISADLSNMFNFIGYTYLIGVLIGILLFRFLWFRNEQKFIRLTDPFALNQS